MINEILNHVKKDFTIEFRNKSAVSIALAFAAVSTLAVSMAGGGTPFPAKTEAVFLWIIIFFSAMNGLAHIFIREQNERTYLFLRINSAPRIIYISKLIFNLIFLIILEIIICPLFIFFLQIKIASPLSFIVNMIAGGIAVASTATILGAIVARAESGASLFTVLCFPLLIPVLTISIYSTEKAILLTGFAEAGNPVFLLAFSGIIISVSIILFKYIWHE